MATLSRFVASLALAAYHKVISPFLPCSCRFYPSCSVYMAQAIEKHGLCRGTLMGILRISRCQPWTPGGFDPVR